MKVKLKDLRVGDVIKSQIDEHEAFGKVLDVCPPVFDTKTMRKVVHVVVDFWTDFYILEVDEAKEQNYHFVSYLPYGEEVEVVYRRNFSDCEVCCPDDRYRY